MATFCQGTLTLRRRARRCRLAQAADSLPGAFKAEIGIYYHAGVTGPEKWQCLVEADIEGTQFDVCDFSRP